MSVRVRLDGLVGAAALPGINQLGEPAVDQFAPLLGRQRGAVRRVALGLRLGRVLGDGAPVDPQAPGDLGPVPARTPMQQDLDDVDHGERSPWHGRLSSRWTRTRLMQQGARVVDPSRLRDYLNAGVLDNLNARPLSCGIT